MYPIRFFSFPVIYVNVAAAHPQKAQVASFCPAGYLYSRHACGTGAIAWTGSGSVEYGPYSVDEYLTNSGHCSCCCNCNSVTVECIMGNLRCKNHIIQML